MRIYLDSCLVIYLIEGEKAVQEAVDKALREDLNREFCVSDLVRLECRVRPVRQGDAELLALYDRFFSSVVTLPMSKSVFDLATNLRASHSIQTPDALHLASALTGECTELWTNDARLSRVPAEIVFRNIFAP